MKRYQSMVACFCAWISANGIAGTMGVSEDWPEAAWTSRNPIIWDRIITASIGPGYSNNNGQSQTFYLQSDVQKTYSATPHSNAIVYGGLFFGFQAPLDEKFSSQFGIAVTGGGNATLKGEIWEDADPDFNNYNYNYDVSELRVTLNGKFLLNPSEYDVSPYLLLGLGVGFNKSHGFEITPDIIEEVAAPFFADHTAIALTYLVGFGVNKVINEDWQFGLGYEFSDWGKSALALAPGQTMGEGLTSSHIYVSTLLFSLTYIM